MDFKLSDDLTLDLKIFLIVFIRGVNRAKISSPARKIFFGPARPAINVL